MRRSTVLALAATMGFAGLGYGVQAQQDERPALPPAEVVPPKPVTPGEAPKPVDAPPAVPAPAADAAVRPLALPPGAAAKELNEQGDIRNAFEAVTEGAIGTDAFDDLTKRLVDADRNRVAKFKDGKPDMKALNDRAAQIRAAWKAKYGKEFDLDEKVVFGQGGFLAMAQGEVSDPTAIAQHWPVPASPDAAAMPAAGRAAADPAKAAAEANKAAGGDRNLDKGRNVAIVRYPASHGQPALDASLIHELPDIWRFDIPDNVDGQRLYDNLLKHLNMLGDGSQWPADQNEAYRAVGHHVLQALYNVEVPMAGGGARTN